MHACLAKRDCVHHCFTFTLEPIGANSDSWIFFFIFKNDHDVFLCVLLFSPTVHKADVLKWPKCIHWVINSVNQCFSPNDVNKYGFIYVCTTCAGIIRRSLVHKDLVTDAGIDWLREVSDFTWSITIVRIVMRIQLFIILGHCFSVWFRFLGVTWPNNVFWVFFRYWSRIRKQPYECIMIVLIKACMTILWIPGPTFHKYRINADADLPMQTLIFHSAICL